MPTAAMATPKSSRAASKDRLTVIPTATRIPARASWPTRSLASASLRPTASERWHGTDIATSSSTTGYPGWARSSTRSTRGSSRTSSRTSSSTLATACPGVMSWVALTDRMHMPVSTLDLLCYEDLLAAESDDYSWPEFDENIASGLCYTSGTTGHPKGVLFSHRSTVLHAMATCLPDAKGYSAQSVVLPIVPMFHVNAWGIPYSAPLVGAKLVFPGAGLDGKSLYELFESERVNSSAGVPT